MKVNHKVIRAAEIILAAALCIANVELYRQFEPSKAAGAALFSCVTLATVLLYENESDKEQEKEQEE